MRAMLQNLSGGAGKFFLRGTARLGSGPGLAVPPGLDGWTVRQLDFESKREALNNSMMRHEHSICGEFVVGAVGLATGRGPVATARAGAVGETGGGAYGGGSGNLYQWVRRSGVCRQRANR